MTKQKEVYRCAICGNIVEVLHPSNGELSCCGQPMKLLTENTTDAVQEKHVPVIERIDGGYKVTVGSVEHPMMAEHYIEWIELIADNVVLRKYLHPGEKPIALFLTEAQNVTAREYCNLHGHWKSK
ncbi:MAG: desulfoferrodoxin [Sphingobacteriia bacterium]|jgi:superoxide reductase|nr:desulfoferrodoxin [Paludibacteraceae bacterium]NCA79993.1 desulfoferrodoxin [Sphingobacteriia bacterium]